MMYYNTDGVEEIEEVEVNVKGVIPVREVGYISRALEIAGVDVAFVDRRAHAPDTPPRHTKAIVMPYSVRWQHRKIGEVIDRDIDLGELDGEFYYIIVPAGSLMGTQERLEIKSRVFVAVRSGERFLHNDVLYEWAVIQSERSFNDTYYDYM